MPYDSSKDPFASTRGRPNVLTNGFKGKPVNPSDGADLPLYVKGLTVLTEGTLSIIPAGNADDEILTFGTLQPGYSVPYQVRRVRSTGTTATVATVED